MAFRNSIFLGSLIAASLFSITQTMGQVHTPGPRFEHRSVESAANTRPFATPGFFDYDMQMFAPVDFSNNDEMQGRSGFYGEIDRVYSSLTTSGNFNGPNGSAISKGSEYIWGNRYQFGWFSSVDDGWGLTYQQSHGAYYINGRDELVGNPMYVNTWFANVELNRTFRQYLKSGAHFEPFIGFRYFNVTDTSIEDTNQVLNGSLVVNRFKQDVKNDMFGAHAGGKFIKHTGRWRTGAKGAIATTYNRQHYFSTDIATDLLGTQGIIEMYDADDRFAPVLDLEFDVAYYITRDISLKLGLQSIYIWDGVARANTGTTSLNPNSAFGGVGLGPKGIFDDSVFSAGFIFGLEWRR